MAHLHLGLAVLLCGVSRTFGVRIINCNNNNKVEIFEDSPAPVTCGDIASTADVVWRRGDGVYIGECGAYGTCFTNFQTDYRLSRSPQSRESQLTLVPDYRRHAGLTVTCHDLESLSTATCTLVISRRASSPESSASIKWIIAVAVTAVILLVVLMTAISIKRLKLRCGVPVYETTVAPAGDVQTYTGLQAGDSIDTVSKTLHDRSEGVVGVMVYENQGQEVQVYPDDSDIYYNSV